MIAFTIFKNLIWCASITGMSYVANHFYGWYGSLFVLCMVFFHMSSKDYNT
jgi:hypothetical protein